MKWGERDQRPDRRDPIVNEFMAECGIPGGPVSIRLIGAELREVTTNIRRLRKVFGARITWSTPQRTSRNDGYVAYGTILE